MNTSREGSSTSSFQALLKEKREILLKTYFTSLNSRSVLLALQSLISCSCPLLFRIASAFQNVDSFILHVCETPPWHVLHFHDSAVVCSCSGEVSRPSDLNLTNVTMSQVKIKNEAQRFLANCCCFSVTFTENTPSEEEALSTSRCRGRMANATTATSPWTFSVTRGLSEDGVGNN